MQTSGCKAGAIHIHFTLGFRSSDAICHYVEWDHVAGAPLPGSESIKQKKACVCVCMCVCVYVYICVCVKGGRLVRQSTLTPWAISPMTDPVCDTHCQCLFEMRSGSSRGEMLSDLNASNLSEREEKRLWQRVGFN